MQPLMLVWILLIGFMFYFLMIKPQKKARAQQVDLLQHLAVGSQVRTTAQIMGTVVELGEDYVVVETTPGTRIKFGKPAVVGIVMPDEPEDPVDAEGSEGSESSESTAVLPTIGDAPATAETVEVKPQVKPEVEAGVKAEDTKVDAEPAAKS